LGYVAVPLFPYALLVGFVLQHSLSVARFRSARYSGNWIYMDD
jgi:hypothetical protein